MASVADAQTVGAPVAASTPSSTTEDLRLVTLHAEHALDRLNGGEIVAVGSGDAAGEGALSLDRAAELAYARSYGVRAADAGLASAAALRRAAFGALLPQVDARYAYGIERSSPASIVDTETGKVVPVDTHRRADLIVTASQPVVDLASIANLARTSHVRNAAADEARGQREDEGYQIVQAYFGLVQASIGLVVANQHHDRLMGLQRWMQGRVAGGGASMADGQQVDGRVLAANALLEQQRAARDQAMIAFEQLTGMRPVAVQLPAGLSNAVPADLETALGLSLANNPTLAGLYENERAAHAESRQALVRFLPRVTVEASQVGAMNAGGDPGWRRDQRAMVVATVSLQPFTHIQNMRAAQAKERQLSYQRLDQQRNVEKAVRLAFSALSAVRVRVDSAIGELEANQQVVTSFDEQFAAGRKSLLELLDAYDRLYQSNTRLLDASLSGALLGYQILRVSGSLTPLLNKTNLEEH